MPGQRGRAGARVVAWTVAAILGLAGCGSAPDPAAAKWVAPSTPGPSTPGPGPSGPRRLTLLGAGDVLVHPQVWQQAQADAAGGGYDFAPMFQGVSPAIAAADLAICHLETPLAPVAGPFAGFPLFSTPPQVAKGIKQAGFDACSTASNHTLDQGPAGITRTADALDAAGLGHTGSSRTPQEAATPTIYDARGVKVGHLSYTLSFNGLRRPAGREWIANLIEPQKIISAAGKVRAAGAEIVVLSLHWGTEYQHAPDANQQTWARQLIASPDIDVILGHHAHVVQPFEKLGDEWVVYGMGNELARHADPVNDNREGVMARITFTEVGERRWRVTKAEAIPTWTDLSPKIRLVDLPVALADPSLSAERRRTYQQAYDRIKGHLLGRGAGPAGLVVVAPPG